MADARKDKRTLLSLKIRYKSATLEDFIERYSTDISRGGVFIKASKPLPVGTLLKFEFMLQDQSTLIHGVGRVVWRREEAEADAQNPPGMGIKFIKMDPESRSVVRRIAEERVEPGVFEHGKEGVQPPSLAGPDSSREQEADRTKVRHVSEFLASALEEGDAGDSVRREANAGAERARQVSDHIGQRAAARGAFSGASKGSARQGRSSEAPSRGAMSAFGGPGSGLASTANMRRSSAAPSMEELDAEDDFLDDETTRIHESYEPDYPHAAKTVVSHDAASEFSTEKRATPVVSTRQTESRVSDLFGPDSFGPAVDSIDPKVLDSDPDPVPGAVPEAPGIPAEAFKLPRANEPAWTMRPAEPESETRGWFAALLLALLVVAAGIASWQLGLADPLIAKLGGSDAPVSKPSQPAALPVAEPTAGAAATAEAEAEPSTDVPAAADESEPTLADQADGPLVKFEVVSAPTGAFISVNGKGVGRTPLELEYPVGTKLSIFSKARGHLARRQKITVEADQPKVEFALSTLPFVVDIITNPLGASASAAGGGATTTPGSLKFKSMSASRRVVIAKDGYKTVTKSVSRSNFIEEPRRMVATISVALKPDGSKPAAPSTPASSDAEPALEPEPEAKAAPPAEEAAPGPTEEPAPAAPQAEPTPPSEPSAAEAP